MPVSQAYTDHVRELLGGLGPIRTRRMFGGVGVYCDDLMFALLADDDLYVKTDALNRRDFEAAASEPFTIEMKGRIERTSYWRLPAEASDDTEAALRWARLGLDAALRAKQSKRPKKKAVAARAAGLGPGPWDEA